MIYLNFEEPIDPEWQAWIDKSQVTTERLIQSFQNGGSIGVIASLYKEQKHRFHGHPFYGKCAYCEAKIEIDSPDYVEHFRPKSGVSDLNNQTVMVLINEERVPHPGYYWLAYYWRNFVPTCWKCNTYHKDISGEMIGKGTRFPVADFYAIIPGEEIREIQLLINPILENPEHHLYIDSLGYIHGITDSIKGETVINIFGLNKREALVNGRKKEYDTIYQKVKAIFTSNNREEKEKELQKIKNIVAGSDSFTIAARKAISDVISEVQNFQSSLNNAL